MKKITGITLLLSCFLLLSKKSDAQDYKTALGLKFGGYENGFSVKYFAKPTVALEGILGFRNHGVIVTGLYEIHQNAFDVPKFNFYYGFGAHLGGVGNGPYRRFNGDDRYYNDGRILLGADGVVGLEYVIPESPIAISLDLNPRIELATGPFFDLAPGLGLKYTF